jgi:hypothetical protein
LTAFSPLVLLGTPQQETIVLSIRAHVVAATLAVAPLASYAQEMPVKSLGPVIGMTATTIGGTNGEADGYETRTGWYVGLQFQRQVPGRARFFRSGFAVARRGGKQTDTSGTRTLNLTYIEVPALIGFNVVQRTRLNAHVLGGLNGAFQLGCSFNVKGSSLSLKFDCDDPGVDFKTKAFDLAGVLGGGIDLIRENGSITITATYAWGFASIDQSSPAGDYVNRGATITIGYKRPMLPK